MDETEKKMLTLLAEFLASRNVASEPSHTSNGTPVLDVGRLSLAISVAVYDRDTADHTTIPLDEVIEAITNWPEQKQTTPMSEKRHKELVAAMKGRYETEYNPTEYDHPETIVKDREGNVEVIYLETVILLQDDHHATFIWANRPDWPEVAACIIERWLTAQE